MRDHEWLETDGLGGFASGTVHGVRTRRYHGLLVAASNPPTGRTMLVNGLDAEVMLFAGRYALTRQHYAPGLDAPTGAAAFDEFSREPWPTWRWSLPDGSTIEHTVFIPHGTPATVLAWRRSGHRAPAVLGVRLFLAGRDYHALHHENADFTFEPVAEGDGLTWRPYDGVPAVHVRTNARYRHDTAWYRRFLYEQEQARGFDAVEDLASPGVLEFDLTAGEALIVLSADVPGERIDPQRPLTAAVEALRDRERARRGSFRTPLHRAADQFLVRRGSSATIIAGYPWFTDWGRDTFIAMRGLCLATERLEEARDILLAWADAVSEGMIPNRFPDRGEEPEFNAVDASLWYVVTAGELLQRAVDRPGLLSTAQRARLHDAVIDIVHAYARGTRYGIRADDDGLLAAGEPGQQLTWMDARAGGREVTPRIGKPVEVQALWINALRVAAELDHSCGGLGERAASSFRQRFWNAERDCLYDVIDVDHVPGAVDPTVRPNQVLAIGGLPHRVLEGRPARAVVDLAERTLWTPLGLRSLAPDDGSYRPRYEGGPDQRDAAYHQGTVWPWLLGPFVEAWLRVRPGGARTRASARRRFIAPLIEHLEQAGLGHVSEITDAEAPHTPRGCPFQAWSLGELLRLESILSRPAVRGEPRRHAGDAERPSTEAPLATRR